MTIYLLIVIAALGYGCFARCMGEESILPPDETEYLYDIRPLITYDERRRPLPDETGWRGVWCEMNAPLTGNVLGMLAEYEIAYRERVQVTVKTLCNGSIHAVAVRGSGEKVGSSFLPKVGTINKIKEIWGSDATVFDKRKVEHEAVTLRVA